MGRVPFTLRFGALLALLCRATDDEVCHPGSDGREVAKGGKHREGSGDMESSRVATRILTSWRKLKDFWCSLLFGEMKQFDEHIFQMDWNHMMPETWEGRIRDGRGAAQQSGGPRYTLEDERLEPTAITHERKGKWSEPNLELCSMLIFRAVPSKKSMIFCFLRVLFFCEGVWFTCVFQKKSNQMPVKYWLFFLVLPTSVLGIHFLKINLITVVWVRNWDTDRKASLVKSEKHGKRIRKEKLFNELGGVHVVWAIFCFFLKRFGGVLGARGMQIYLKYMYYVLS